MLVCFLSFDLLDVCINGPKEKLDLTVISQVALFLGSQISFFFHILSNLQMYLLLATFTSIIVKYNIRLSYSELFCLHD